ncbi:MAG: primase-helicase family protein [Rhodoferax sp.]
MLPNTEQEGNRAGVEPGTVSTVPAKPPKPEQITPAEFFQGVAVNHPDAVQAVVTTGRDGTPNDHNWCKPGADFGPWAADKAKGRKPAYISMAAFNSESVGRFNGRKKENVVAVRGAWFDIEGSADKYDKPGGADGGYRDGPSVMKAVGPFVRDTGLTPSYLVSTGSGGVHLHFTLSEPITPAEWLGRTKTLVALAKLHGLKIDAQCTTDAARIMRAPGSLHQKTGYEVIAYRWKVEPYTLDEWDRLTYYEPGAVAVPELGTVGAGSKYNMDVNGDVSGVFPAFSYTQAATRCGAMRGAAQGHGQDTPYPVWILAAKAADLSTEGREFAQSISAGHADYDEATTDKKIDSLTGGPASCEAWANAYGAGGPCESCEYRGKIKNPAIQLGALVDTTPPGSVALVEPETVLGWVAELNQRFALVRHGSKLVIVDFQTPSMTGRGVAHGIGFLDVAGFRSMLNGRFAPIQKAGDKQRALSDSWLAHPQRRQYEGLVYAPGEVLSADMLNLWQGFAVEPIAGDVSLWLEVLAALVPNELERRYVLRWLAWKIQNPGGVPDTILIFKGAKGTGKNSLFDPIILLFGRHAMLADDPELIAGRFTWHLMSLSFAVLDEAVFIQDPRQADRIKSRITAKTMHYEQKGMDPVQGVNRCAYVMLTNHEYVWQATSDERRAVVVEVGETMRGNLEFWKRYHAWALGDGPAALLHYLQAVDLTGFNPRVIPKGEALRKQVEQTALRSPAAAWWHQCITEGVIRWVDGTARVIHLDDTTETEIDRAGLRLSYEQSAAARGKASSDWATVAKRLVSWAGPAGIGKVRPRTGAGREWRDVLPPLAMLRAAFTAATQVEVSE